MSDGIPLDTRSGMFAQGILKVLELNGRKVMVMQRDGHVEPGDGMTWDEVFTAIDRAFRTAHRKEGDR
mgnify:CR=1 FL=1